MRLACVGSSNITNAQVGLAEMIIRGVLVSTYVDTLVSGGAKGIDSVAEGVAFMLDIPTKIYLPSEPRWEPNGYKERNLLIAEDCTHLLCIRTQQSTTYGSGWTADRAEEMGKTVWRVTI